MYYRYEVKNEDGQYVGIFCELNPDQRRHFNRFLKEPKWYQKNPGKESRCWFTELGYQKYHHVIDEMISEMPSIEVRLLCIESLARIAMKGKI